MAAYDAVVTLKYAILRLIKHSDLVLSKYRPSFLEILHFTGKELKSFQEFVEGLEKKSRMRMKVPLQQIVEATRAFTQVLGFYVPKIIEHPQLMLDESEAIVDLDQVCRDIHGFTQAAHSFIDTLKKVKEEYLKVQDEDEAHVDSRGKMVGLSDVYGELKRNIISHRVHDVVVSLVGMAGVGKTTLAKKLLKI